MSGAATAEEPAMVPSPPDAGRELVARALLAIGASLAIALLWSRRGYVPLWDGRIYADCVAAATQHATVAAGYRCAGHISESYVALLVLGQVIAPGAATFIAVNAILLALAACALWRLACAAFPAAEHAVGRSLVVAAFLVHPIVLASAVQPGLDFGLLVFSLAALAAAVERRRWAFAALGLLLVFAKEPGVVLYGVLAIAHLWRQGLDRASPRLPYLLAVGALAVLALLNALARDLADAMLFLAALVVAARIRAPQVATSWRELRALAVREWPVVLPVAALAAYMLAHATGTPVATNAGGATQSVVWGNAGAGELLRTLFRAGILDRASLAVLALVFVVGFLWIPTIVVGGDAIASVARRLRNAAPPITAGIDAPVLALLAAVLVADVWLLSRFVTYSNARYYLPVHPLVLLLTLGSLIRLRVPRMAREALLGLLVLLFTLSAVRTVDPLSRALWGTFEFGEHEMLRITSLTGECCGHGRDQLAYNLEFTRFDELQGDLYQRLRIDGRSPIVLPVLGDWFTVGPLDALTRRRSLDVGSSFQPFVLSAAQAYSLRTPVPSAWYVELPYVSNELSLAKLRERYEFAEPRWVVRDGYALSVRGMRLRTLPLGSPPGEVVRGAGTARPPR